MPAEQLPPRVSVPEIKRPDFRVVIPRLLLEKLTPQELSVVEEVSRAEQQANWSTDRLIELARILDEISKRLHTVEETVWNHNNQWIRFSGKWGALQAGGLVFVGSFLPKVWDFIIHLLHKP